MQTSRFWILVAAVLAFWFGSRSTVQSDERAKSGSSLRVDSIVVGDYENGAGIKIEPNMITLRGKDDDGEMRTMRISSDMLRVHQVASDFVWLGRAGSVISANECILRDVGDALHLRPSSLEMKTWGGDATLFSLTGTWPQGKGSKTRSGELVLRDHKNKVIAKVPKSR